MGANRLFLLIGGWIGFGAMKQAFSNPDTPGIDEPDGIFCIDRLAKRILAWQAPHLSTRLFVTGTPEHDLVQVEQGEGNRKTCRKKLGIPDDAFVLLYMGDNPPDYLSMVKDKKLTSLNALAVKQLIKDMQQVTFPRGHAYLLLRPHPRDRSPGWAMANRRTRKAPRIHIKNACSEVLTLQEAIYGADIVSGFHGTEIARAPHRGRIGVFFRPPFPGIPPIEYYTGNLLLEQLHLRSLTSEHGLSEAIWHYLEGNIPPFPPRFPYGNSAAEILEIVART